MIAPFPPNETNRLNALHRLQVLDTEPEIEFDRITRLASKIYHTPIALVSLVDTDRQWFKACVGLPDTETSRDQAFCAHTILQERTMVVPNALEDPRFANYPNVTGYPHIRFYAGAPLISSDGYALGSLCVIDTKPRTGEHIDTAPLEDLAATATELLEKRWRLRELDVLQSARIQSAQNHEAIIAKMPHVAYQIDELGRWTFLNSAWTRLTGLSLFRTVGAPWVESVHRDDRGRAEELWSRVVEKPVSFEETFRFVTRSGAILWLQMSSEVVRRTGDVFGGLIGTLHDLTALKTTQASLVRSKNEASESATTLNTLIEESRQLEGKLMSQQERFDLTMDAVGRAFIEFGQNGEVTNCNYAAEGLFDRPRLEIIGQNIANLILPSDGRQAAHFTDSGAPITTGKPFAVRFSRNGQPRDGEVTIWPLSSNDGLVYEAFLDDASEKKRGEADTLRRNELNSLLQRITSLANRSESVKECFQLCLEQFCIYGNFDYGRFFAAPQLASEIGFKELSCDKNKDREDLPASLTDGVCSEFDIGNRAAAVADVAPIWYEDFGVDQTGRVKSEVRSGCAFSVVGSGQVFGVFAFFNREPVPRDEQLMELAPRINVQLAAIISRKLMENSLKQATLAAESASSAKSSFVAAMSHEIRTPMNAILGMADVLAETPLNEEQSNYVKIFRRAGTNLLALLNGILDLSKIEAGYFELENIDFDLFEVVERTLEVIRPRLKSPSILLSSKIAKSVSPGRIGDPTRVQQILVNLLGNAAKFTDTGEVSLAISQETEKQAELLKFEVSDTGIGIPSDKLTTIFQDFSQVDASTTRKYGGTGLGLGIARRLIDMMHGTIEVSSILKKGTTFTFTLRLPVAKTIFGLKEPSQEFRGCDALIIGADSETRSLVATTLESWGFSAVSCDATGRACQKLEVASPTGRPYSLVVFDLSVGSAKSAGLAVELRMRFPRVPLIFLSQEEEQTASDHLSTAGLRYLRTPLSRAALLQVVRDMLASELDSSARALVGRNTLQKRILIADDSMDNQLLVKAYLKDSSHILVFAENGQEALDLSRRQDFDLILMDMQMPVMDGLTATRAIRQMEADLNREATPILAVTANALTRDVGASHEAGSDGHLTKPISKNRLLGAIEEYAKRTKSARREKDTEPVEITEGLEALAPEYLERRRTEAAQLAQLLADSDIAKIREVSHNMAGTGGSFGFTRLTELGAEIEDAARASEIQKLASKIAELQRYLASVEFTPAKVA